MEDIDVASYEQEKRRAAQEDLRLKVAFGDNVALRFLTLRGIVGEAMQEAVLERYASKQADRLARDAIALAAYLPPRHPAVDSDFDNSLQGDDEVDLADMI